MARYMLSVNECGTDQKGVMYSKKLSLKPN